MNDPSRITNEHLLSISWHDSAWIPHLGHHNVMDYFSERSNPFYDRTCNNEVLKMQRASPEQLTNMQGVEYCLLFVQEPILYVIRKQHRHSPTQVTPISDYYVIAGIVYQAPDIGSILNSRILSAVSHLQSAFEEARGYARYHPSRGYWWDFKGTQTTSHHGVPAGAKPIHPTSNSTGEEKKKKPKPKKKEEGMKVEPSSMFQRQRVDVLLDLITRRFPPKISAAAAPAAASAATNGSQDVKPDLKDTVSVAESVKSEKSTTEAVTSSSTQDRGMKRDASAANIRTPSLQDGKKLKMQ